ncbi:hypothetical protein RHSIM_Rhsim12G0135600 [Rhododendron simsii]|uniref:Pentatricopeptide repeat-containing protein n=1 Tax=Rhododendron simsii TaxID=118357 RepID=A0A834L8K6_RHOSS|nr:hypothetical protein RHSIM_Rhsim12G0135600 [Rhododendron simsii]
MKARTVAKPLKNLFSHLHLRTLSTNSITPVDESQLLRVSTVLYQQQNSPQPQLHTHLHRCQFQLTHEFFLQICNKFPLSWKPVYRFFQFTQTQPQFNHTSTTFNKMLDVIGKSRNIELLWEVANEMGRRGIVDCRTYRIALSTLASARELKRCVEFFHVMGNGYGLGYSVERLNEVVENLCKSGLVVEAVYVVKKLRDCVRPNGLSYKWLVFGFCDVGDLVEASKVWNLMVDDGFEPGTDVVEKMMETLFKNNRFNEGLNLFQMMRVGRINDLGLSTYHVVIKWMCKVGKLGQARMVFDEMRQRGIQADNATMGCLVYGLLAKGRVREAYVIAEGLEKPDINVYHGMIKGLLRLRKPSEATQVFREMIKKGCEPTMHTYVMLLQGHLGKRGRKGSDPLVNFDTIFVGGLVKAGKSLEATKYVERVINRQLEVPRFDYNRFLHYYSNEEGVVMFEVMSKKLREVGLFDLADIFERYGEKMATRDRRRNRATEVIESEN